MRYLLVIMAAVLIGAIANADTAALEDQINRSRAPNAVATPVLALEIEQVALENGLSPRDLAALVLQESGGRALAYNPTTHDHGLTQINNRSAIQHHVSVRCLYDWRCNLRQGAKLYAAGKRPCLYNLGSNRRLEGKYLRLCQAYESKLASLY